MNPEVERAHRVGDRAVGVVVEMDSEQGVGPGAHRGDGRGYSRGEGASVGVTEHHSLGSGAGGGLDHGEGVVGVVAEAVEEVLCIEEDPLAPVSEELNRLSDHVEPLFE